MWSVSSISVAVLVVSKFKLHNVHVFYGLDNSAHCSSGVARLSKNMKTMPNEVTYQEKVFKSKSVFNYLKATINVFLGASFQGISIIP